MELRCDAPTVLLVAWSLGLAQLTFVFICLGFVLYGACVSLAVWLASRPEHLGDAEAPGAQTRRPELIKAWKPLAISTVCLIPAVGGAVGAQMYREW